MSEGETRIALAALIEKHLPTSSRMGFGSDRKSELWSDLLIQACVAPTDSFGVAAAGELEKIEHLRRAAAELQRAIVALQAGTMHSLNSANWLKSEPQKPLSHEAYLWAYLIEEAAKTECQRLTSLPSGGRKRNWRAASVAGACREIWGAENWVANPERYGSNPLANMLYPFATNEEFTAAYKRHEVYRQHLETFAPVAEKHDAPGPFGRFLRDVLGALNIVSESGEPVSAQVALRSWYEARKQQRAK